MKFFLLLSFGANSLIYSFSLKNIVDSKASRAIELHPDGEAGTFRVFHPAFPSEIVKPISIEKAQEYANIKSMIGNPENDKFSQDELIKAGLPWKILPEMGISSSPDLMSKSQLVEACSKSLHYGHIVWAHKLPKVEKGCLIVNHWNQKVLHITDYDPHYGARGVSLDIPLVNKNVETFWPPLTLELELRERKWQPVAVSDNILSGEVLKLLPMSKATWELIFLLMTSVDNETALQALFDTGLCPKQGLIAYIRLLKQVELRTASWDGIPAHLKIFESSIEL